MGRHLESFCALESRLANAPLMGTAPRVDVWLLLEYAQAWGHKALEESEIPEPVKQFLTVQTAAIPNARIQLIRHRHRSRNMLAEVTFSIVLSREVNPVAYTFKLPHYDAVPDLDLPGIVSGASEYDPHISSEPLYLVCTNGRRDACCSSRGLLVYNTLSQDIGPSVWQTTHIGGHRFAANLVCLPQGIVYGRVDDFEPAELFQAHSRKHLFTPALRGRSCYDPVVQAAESFLHTNNNGLALDDYRLSSMQGTTPDEWTICFEGPDDTQHYLTIAIELGAEKVRASCGSDNKEPVTLYRLSDYRRNG